MRLQVEWACKPDSVVDDHLSGTVVADGLTRAYPSAGRASLNRSYWLLLRVGFAKPPSRPDAGALLPHRFSFSPVGEPAGEFSFLWHFPSAHAAQPLAGTLPSGVRTFLTPESARGRPAHSGCQSTSGKRTARGNRPVATGPAVRVHRLPWGASDSTRAALRRLSIEYGSPYGIRTRDLRLERAMS